MREGCKFQTAESRQVVKIEGSSLVKVSKLVMWSDGQVVNWLSGKLVKRPEYPLLCTGL